MICKKDVIQWFKELESYKRIDTMCSLLLVCLPFELRFLGTCLEELGRRDSQDLRGMELRVNNPQDLATDMVACQKGEPTDIKIRRRMALYLALLRACNRTCVAEIFRTLECWGERDFSNMNDQDTLQELLLVYTMAANHPVFSFDQHLKCTEVLEKIKENKLISEQIEHTVPQAVIVQHSQHTEPTMNIACNHQESRHHLPPLHAIHTGAQQHSQLFQMIPQGSIPISFSQPHMQKCIANDGSLQHQFTVDGIQQMLSANITIPGDTNTILAQPNTGWAFRPYSQPSGTMEHPPQSSSPMLSQQPSPSSSRTSSPNRSNNSVIIQHPPQQHQSQQQSRNMSQRPPGSIKNIRRPSSETTPPPISSQHPQMMPNELILPQNLKHMDDVIANDSTGNQLQILIRNGYTRTGHHQRVKAATYIPPHQHQHHSQQQQQSPVTLHFQGMPSTNYPANSGVAYNLENMSISDIASGQHAIENNLMTMTSNKSTGSDSGGSIVSSSDISPPETPTLLTNSTSTTTSSSITGLRLSNESNQNQKHQQQLNYQKQINLTRLNGRSEKIAVSNSSNLSNSTGTVIYQHSPLLPTSHQPQPQTMYGSETIALANNNNNNNSNGGVNIITSTNNAGTNNNMSSIATFIGSPTNVSVAGGAGGAGNIIGGNVITTNSLQTHQQQYRSTYPYHSAAEHLAVAASAVGRPPPLIATNAGMPPPPHGAFRLPGAFQLQPNSEIIYPGYHPTAITFLTGGPAPTVTPQVSLRSSTSSSSLNTNTITAPPGQLSVPVQHPTAAMTNSAMLPASAYLAALSINKPLSCYNCGSQNHSGRDCQEASMEDATRNAIYKLDYSVSTANASSSTTISTTNSNMPNEKQIPHTMDNTVPVTPLSSTNTSISSLVMQIVSTPTSTLVPSSSDASTIASQK